MAVTVSSERGNVQIQVDSSGECFDLSKHLTAVARAEGGRGLQIVRKLADSLVVERSQRHPCRVIATLALKTG